MSRTGEPHRGLGRLFVRKRTRWPHLWARTPRPAGLMEPRPQGLRPWQPLPHRAHAHHPFLVASISGEKRIVHAKTSAPPQRSVRAGNCRWHPTTAGPMDDCCSLLLAALARIWVKCTKCTKCLALRLKIRASVVQYENPWYQNPQPGSNIFIQFDLEP